MTPTPPPPGLYEWTTCSDWKTCRPPTSPACSTPPSGSSGSASATSAKRDDLKGKVVVNLFFEPSTRTRVSFGLAARRLGADVQRLLPGGSSTAKGETFIDTAKNIEAMGVDAVVVRHSSPGAPHLLARHLRPHVRVVNAGDGAHEHPTQGLLDIFTIRQRKGRVAGLTVGLVGDIAHSRVARSNIHGLTKLGAKVIVCGPPTLVPPGGGAARRRGRRRPGRRSCRGATW